MKRFSLLTTLIILLSAANLHAELINVADHGIVPGQDVTLAVNRLIENVCGKKNVILSFPKGQYDFFPDNGLERYRAVANHDNGLKRMGFPLFECDNITIDGGGSIFMFHGRMVPVTVERSTNVTLKNFTVDWIRSFHAELEVVQSDPTQKSFVVQTDPQKHPYKIAGGKILFERFGQDDPIGSNIVFDPKTHAPIYDTKQYNVNSNKAKITAVAENQFRIENGVKVPPPVGSVLVVYGVHPTSRLCPAIHVTNSKNVNLENVKVLEAGGMALIVERTDNISLDRMVVTSHEERFAATRADATHFIGCKGKIKVENCLFEHMLDDGINVHGAYVKVQEYLGDREFLCEISHFQQWGLTFAEPGDKVKLLSRETILPIAGALNTGAPNAGVPNAGALNAGATVQSIQKLNEHRFIMKLDKVPDEIPPGPLSVENLTWYPDLEMRKNTIRQNRARSVLVTTKGTVTIEDNSFSSQMHGILIEGDNNKWYESGAVGDVKIRNNVFENVGYSAAEAYPLLASPLFTADQHWGEGYYHRNIEFTDNTIKSFNGLLAKAKSVQGLDVSRNRMQFSKNYPAKNGIPSVDLEYCDDVTIQGNQFAGFDNELTVKVSDDCTNIDMSDNKGLVGSVVAKANDTAKPKPNIVLLFVDDLGWHDLGYRNEKFETPNIDALAAVSVDFQRAYIASPTCSPSRATLLTGKHPARLQMVRHIPGSNHDGFDQFGRTEQEFHQLEGDPAKFPSRNWLPLEHTTYAEALAELGYHNEFFGKWHLGHEPYHPVHQGFHRQTGTTNAGHPRSYTPPFFKNSDVWSDEQKKYLTDKLTDESVAFIKNYNQDKPFMLSMWYYNVHRPPVARDDLLKHFRDKGLEKADAIYAAQVKAVDESVGRIRSALTAKSIDKNTVVIFLSDQGSWYQNLPFRGSKRVDTLCEGGARVPMMVHWPGVAKPRRDTTNLVQSTDLFPTMVEIAGGNPADHKNLDGVSLLSTIRDNKPVDRIEPLFGYRAYQDLYASVREGDWNMLAYRDGRIALYNVADDISEKNDISASNPAVTNLLVAKLIAWEKRMGVEEYSGVQ